MLHKGKAKCPKDGIFEWQVQNLDGEKSDFSGIDKNVKFHNAKLNLIIANCPICGSSITVNYDFKRKTIIESDNG